MTIQQVAQALIQDPTKSFARIGWEDTPLVNVSGMLWRGDGNVAIMPLVALAADDWAEIEAMKPGVAEL